MARGGRVPVLIARRWKKEYDVNQVERQPPEDSYDLDGEA